MADTRSVAQCDLGVEFMNEVLEDKNEDGNPGRDRFVKDLKSVELD